MELPKSPNNTDGLESEINRDRSGVIMLLTFFVTIRKRWLSITGSHHLLKNYDVIFKVLALGSKTVILLFFL
jgi:hypothetical protein